VDIALRILNYGADVEHYDNIDLNAAAGYVTPKEMAAGRRQEIHAERDRKLA